MNQLNQLMKQAQEMQKKLLEMQNKVQSTEFKGEAGAGMVRISMLGNFNILNIEISDELLNIEEKDTLCDLIKNAHKDVIEKINNEMSSINKKLGMPAGF